MERYESVSYQFSTDKALHNLMVEIVRLIQSETIEDFQHTSITIYGENLKYGVIQVSLLGAFADSKRSELYELDNYVFNNMLMCWQTLVLTNCSNLDFYYCYCIAFGRQLYAHKLTLP